MCRDFVDDWIIVSEDEIAEAIYFILNKHHKVLHSILSHLSRIERLRNEPPRGKTNNVVSEQVRQKPSYTSTEDG